MNQNDDDGKQLITLLVNGIQREALVALFDDSFERGEVAFRRLHRRLEG